MSRGRLVNVENGGRVAVYCVAHGDTLSHIAQAMLGDASRWRELTVTRCGESVTDGIWAGDIVYLPAHEWDTLRAWRARGLKKALYLSLGSYGQWKPRTYQRRIDKRIESVFNMRGVNARQGERRRP